MGDPGQSHALDIAKKYGLPDHVLEAARELLGGISLEFDNLIADLNEKRARYENTFAELAAERWNWREKRVSLKKKLRSSG